MIMSVRDQVVCNKLVSVVYMLSVVLGQEVRLLGTCLRVIDVIDIIVTLRRN